MNELLAPTVARPSHFMADERAECRLCKAHVRVSYRNSFTATAWCSTCCTTSVYDLGTPRTTA